MRCAMKSTCCSLSITHGPAINATGAASPIATPPPRSIRIRKNGRALLRGLAREAALVLLPGGADERAEQRVRLQGLRFELGMELAAEVPGMIRNLADLDVGSVGRLARD